MGKRKPTAEIVRAADAVIEKARAAMPGSSPGAPYLPAPAPTAHLTEVELQQYFTAIGALLPPYDPVQCIRLYERSSALRPNVEAYATNIDGFGYHLEPVIDLDKSDADERILDALTQERHAEGNFMPPTPEDVTAQKEIIRRGMRLEKAYLSRFFDYACSDMSFVELRDRTCKEKEQTGNAYWEVIRNGYGEIVGFSIVPTRTMRLRPMEWRYHDVPTPQKSSEISYETVNVKRRFRTFVQVVYGVPAVYFKEFGDPRILSSRTGRYFSSVEHLREYEGDDATPANELIHWYIFSALGPYGVPRWVGSTLAIAGLRMSEEVNTSYFDSKGVPPFAILVSGGKLAKGGKEKLEQYLKEHHQGIENFHSVLILEADSANNQNPTARCRLELKNLMDAQLDDALFQKYEANSDKKIARQFRLPDLIRGASQEVNRAQAEAVLQFAEQQVFQPERGRFDEVMNRRIFADMQIRFWKFATNSAPSKDPDAMTSIALKWVEGGVLTPGEARPLAGEVFNKDFPPLDDQVWTKQPIELTLAGYIDGQGLPAAAAPDAKGPAASGAGGVPNVGAKAAEADGLVGALQALRGQLDAAAAAGHAEHVVAAKRGRQVITIPKSVIDSWFEPEDPQP